MAISERFHGANIVDAGRRSPYWGEHVARYVFARPYVRGKRVLDIACGTGYVVGLMKCDADLVVGIDIDDEAVRQAASECGSNAAVLLGDGHRLPFGDETFDVVTTFETIEHLEDRSGYLAELKRVMCNQGVMVLSTPNANYTQPHDGRPENPFHVHEYTPEELRAEIEGKFTVLAYLGQSLNDDIGISPFEAEQRQMPKDLSTQTRLLGWKVMNKMPFRVREALSEWLRGRPFYPTEVDYNFSEAKVQTAPTLVAVCRKA